MSFEYDTLSICLKDEGIGITELPREPDIEKNEEISRIYNNVI